MTPDREQTLARLESAVRRLEGCPEFAALVPEVRTNFACVLPGAAGPEDVAAIDGRLTVVGGLPRAAGPVRFGASDHLARRIIEFRRFDPAIRSALNFRWNEQLLEFVRDWARERGLAFGALDRAAEPAALIGANRASMPWKVRELVAACGGRVPPVFYEGRGWGKEPLFLLVGPDPAIIADRAVDIARRCQARTA
ncbi:MAG: thiamine-phosphate synthase family protein [bacterium]